MSDDWSPYVDNAGTVCTVAGPDYAILASDTRLSLGYEIASRNISKIKIINDKIALASPGMHADAINLHKQLIARVCYKLIYSI